MGVFGTMNVVASRFTRSEWERKSDMVVPIEAVRRGMGFDEAGRWHEARARYMPARKDAGDPLATARGVMAGLLISAFMWIAIIVVVRALFLLLH
jgi:hypothetical protein